VLFSTGAWAAKPLRPGERKVGKRQSLASYTSLISFGLHVLVGRVRGYLYPPESAGSSCESVVDFKFESDARRWASYLPMRAACSEKLPREGAGKAALSVLWWLGSERVAVSYWLGNSVSIHVVTRSSLSFVHRSIHLPCESVLMVLSIPISMGV
jgi:hypothetical protein